MEISAYQNQIDKLKKQLSEERRANILISQENADLKLKNANLIKQIEDLKSGEKYTRMESEYKHTIVHLNATIKQKDKEIEELHSAHRKMRNRWFEVFDDMIREKNQILKRFEKAKSFLEKKLFDALNQRDEKKDEIKELKKTNKKLEEENKEKDERYKQLKSDTKKDHTNSSKPSSQNPNHDKIYNSRKKAKNKRGGQFGHKGHGRKWSSDSVEIILDCSIYENNPRYRATGKEKRKQSVKIVCKAYTEEYVAKEYYDKETGKYVYPEFPDGVINDVNYDPTVKAMAYILNNICNVSIGKTRQFIKDISNNTIDISTGMICNLSKEFSRKTENERDEIFKDLLTGDKMHTDFTFCRTGGKQGAVIICANDDSVLYMGRKKKGDEGVKGSPLEYYDGSVISDHEAALIKHGTRHQECLDHIDRYCNAAVEREPHNKWPVKFKAWIKKGRKYWWNVQKTDAEDATIRENLLAEYDEIMEIAKKEYEKVPPSKYYKDAFNLYSRMSEDKDSYTLFLVDTTIPPSNSAAERLARTFKMKAKQVMCFRSFDGLCYLCDGLSVIETLKKRDKRVYETVITFFKRPTPVKIADDSNQAIPEEKPQNAYA